MLWKAEGPAGQEWSVEAGDAVEAAEEISCYTDGRCDGWIIEGPRGRPRLMILNTMGGMLLAHVTED